MRVGNTGPSWSNHRRIFGASVARLEASSWLFSAFWAALGSFWAALGTSNIDFGCRFLNASAPEQLPQNWDWRFILNHWGLKICAKQLLDFK